MALLPDVQDLGPRPVPQARRTVATVRNAGAVAEAVSEFGATGSRVLTRLEEIRDEDDVRRLDVEHSAEARRIRLEARQARGLNAQEARQTAETQLAELDQRIAGRARSGTSRRTLETMISRRSTLERDNIYDYAERETTTAMGEAITARIGTALEEAEENWSAPEVVEQRLGVVVAEITNRGRWRGTGQDQVDNEIAAARSRVRASVVEQMIQADDFPGAAAYLEAHAGEIDHEKEVRLRALVNGELQLQQADSDAAGVLTGTPGAAPAAGTPAAGTPAPPARPAEPDRPGRFQMPGGFTAGDGVGARRGTDGTGTHAGLDTHAPEGTPFPVGQRFRVIESHRQTQSRNGRNGGNIATIELADGSRWQAMHLPDLPRPGEYEAGAPILRSGFSGTSGRGSSHIHWQPANEQARAIYAQGRRAVAATLTGTGGEATAAQGRTPPPDGRRIDIDAAYARIDEKVRSGEWTEARGRRARERVRTVAGENDLVRQRDRQDADEEITRALTQITAGGGRLTRINQLPAGALSRASPNVVLQLQEMIRSNNQPVAPEGNSPLMASLVNRAANDPNGFLRDVNPELYRGRIPDGEVMQLHGMRNTIQNRDGAQPSQILGMIRFTLPETGLIPSSIPRGDGPQQRHPGETDAQARSRIGDALQTEIFSAVQQRIARNFPRGTQPTEQDILNAVRAETMTVTIGGRQMRNFEARRLPGGVGQETVIIPTRALPYIDSVIRASGRQVSGRERIAEYQRHKSEYDAR